MLKKSGVLCVLAVAALIGLGAGAGLAQDKVYVNGFDAAYPPFSFIELLNRCLPEGVETIQPLKSLATRSIIQQIFSRAAS